MACGSCGNKGDRQQKIIAEVKKISQIIPASKIKLVIKEIKKN